MSVLVDFQIKALAENGAVDPFDPSLLNPASLDVRLGKVLMIEVPGTDEMIRVSIEESSREEPFWLPPGAFCLAETVESFALNERTACQFVLKSSRAREGLNHLLAGWCDPGWGYGGPEKRSVLTMELKNNRQLAPVALWSGMKIGQMKFFALSEPPLSSYAITGRYNGDWGVQESKG